MLKATTTREKEHSAQGATIPTANIVVYKRLHPNRKDCSVQEPLEEATIPTKKSVLYKGLQHQTKIV